MASSPAPACSRSAVGLPGGARVEQGVGRPQRRGGAPVQAVRAVPVVEQPDLAYGLFEGPRLARPDPADGTCRRPRPCAGVKGPSEAAATVAVPPVMNARRSTSLSSWLSCVAYGSCASIRLVRPWRLTDGVRRSRCRRGRVLGGARPPPAYRRAGREPQVGRACGRGTCAGTPVRTRSWGSGSRPPRPGRRSGRRSRPARRSPGRPAVPPRRTRPASAARAAAGRRGWREVGGLDEVTMTTPWPGPLANRRTMPEPGAVVRRVGRVSGGQERTCCDGPSTRCLATKRISHPRSAMNCHPLRRLAAVAVDASAR